MTPAEEAALRLKILEAETEYHALVLGIKARVFVDQNGERVEFAKTDASELRKYITYLQSLLPNSTVTTWNPPLGYFF